MPPEVPSSDPVGVRPPIARHEPAMEVSADGFDVARSGKVEPRTGPGSDVEVVGGDALESFIRHGMELFRDDHGECLEGEVDLMVRGLTIMAHSTRRPGLADAQFRLDLHNWDLRRVGPLHLAESIASTPVLYDNIVSFDLRRASIDDDALIALAAHLPPAVRDMDLRSNAFGARGLTVLCAAFLRRPIGIVALNVSDNAAIGDAGTWPILRVAAACPTLTSLDLFHIGWSRDGALVALRALAHCASLRRLAVGMARVGDQGAGIVAAGTAPITDLAMDNCSIGDPGARSLALSQLRLHALHLRDNWIGDDGARAIASAIATKQPSLRHVDLTGNVVTGAGRDELVRVQRQCSVSLSRNAFDEPIATFSPGHVP